MSAASQIQHLVRTVYSIICQNTKDYSLNFILNSDEKIVLNRNSEFVGRVEEFDCVLTEVVGFKISWKFLYYITNAEEVVNPTTVLELHQWGVVICRLLLPEIEISTICNGLSLKIKDFFLDWEILFLLLKNKKIVVKRIDAHNINVRVAPQIIKNSKHLKNIITNCDYIGRDSNSDVTGHSILDKIYVYLP